jgi:iron(III) transport system ATP-binding protein
MFQVLDTAAVIQARKLFKVFKSAGGDVRALNGVDLDVVRGQMLVLLGPSGCGKTTLLRCIGGLESPTSGSVSLGGTVVTSVNEGIDLPPEHRNLGMMFQSYGLWPHMTVFENIAYPLTNQKNITKADIRERVTAMMQTMGVGALGDRYPGQLSGGQQQRVALARALVGSPVALLFDEPLSNVDAQVRKRLREEMRQMKEARGFAGVYVTHDQEEAMALADVLAVMQDGEIRQIGAPWEIYHRPKSLYVAHFIGEANTLEARVRSVGNGRVVAETEAGLIEIAQDGIAPAEGARGHVVIRPEDFAVTLSGASSGLRPNSYKGTVANATLLGPHVELWVGVGEKRLRVWAGSKHQLKFPPGAAVELDVDAEAATWISE